jgi:methylmalonyl-CoA mutase N-terminal domain/subunit
VAPSYNAPVAKLEDRETSPSVAAWRERLFDRAPERQDELFSTISGIEVDPLYTPESAELDYARDLGYPGEAPFTRGVYPSMYRGRLWTMRQFAGFGTAEETNERFRYLLDHGQTGLSTAFDMPTLMGYDSDHPRSLAEVGREGVAVDSLDDMQTLFSGIPLGEVSTSMTINSPAAIVLAYYVCVGEEQGVPRDRRRGTAQTDILKEYIAQKEWIFPPEPSMRLVVDMVEFCAREMPLFHPISISGYHIREAGSTAAQELAFTLADGFAYVEAAIERGLDVEDFAPRLSFFFNAHLDFFEEIAKYRAARRIWARELRDRYGATSERARLMRFHTQTAGVSLTAQQPEVNIVRTALEALAAVLGGTQSLHTNSFDEALALPTEDAVRLALRTQQVIAHEAGVVNTIDPLGGSYYVEHLTNVLEEQAYEYFERIDKLGGVIAAIKDNFFQREIADASYRYQSEVETGQRIVVGVNRYVHEDETPIPILKIDEALERKQVDRLAAVRGRRDSSVVEARLVELKTAAAKDGVNLMAPIVDASRDYVTLGEMCDALRDVWGIWRETPVF